MTRFFGSLQSYLAFIAGITTLVMASVSGVLVYQVQTSRSEQENRELVKSLMATVHNTAAIAAFANNQQIGQDVIDGLLKNEVVQRAELTTNQGLKIISKRPGVYESNTPLTEEIKSPFSADEVVGTLKVEPNRQWIQKKAKESALTLVSWIAVLIVLTATISMVVIHRTLDDPLVTVVKQLNQITPGEAAQLAIPSHLENNEVGTLVKGVNHLLDKVREALELERTLRSQVEATEAQLRVAMIEIESAAKAKGDFLASMSHEIRTPLNGVIGTLDLLSLSELNNSQREQVNAMREASDSLLGIINDILDFSKIEAGKMDINVEPINLPQLMNSICNLYRDTSSSKGLGLDLKLQGVDQNVLCDPLRIRQIVSNLISNALKFTKQGGVTIKAQGTLTSETELGLRIDVIDTGIGIPAESQWKVFSAFSQAEADTAKRFGGTGLGLSICKRLCELMDGSISLSSVHGKGTTFTVNLPLKITEQAPVSRDVDNLAKQVKPADAGTELLTVEQAEAQGCLIGMVDDNAINRYVLSRQLSLLGFTSVVAEDGLQALEMYRKHKLAMLITDCQMPGMDGYELSRAIRAEEAAHGRPALPILACTASALQGEAEKCEAAGMSDYLTKPLQLPMLSAMLRKWMPVVESPSQATASALPSAETPMINHQQWEDLTAGDDAVKAVLATEFIETTKSDLIELKGLVISDLIRTKAKAHSLKGAALSIGAQALGGYCADLETACSANELHTAALQVNKIDSELQRVVTWLGQHIQ